MKRQVYPPANNSGGGAMKRLLVILGLVLGLLVPAFDTTLATSHSTSSSKSSDKKVYVKGYYRKDGTYVAPHYRSAPGSGDSKGSTTTGGGSTTLPSGKGCKDCPRDSQGRIKRSSTARDQFMRQTGYPHGRPGYVVDHIVPLECGGADDPSNMQWQTIAEGKAKDKTESNCRR
jgi:hypothetical protein